MKGIYLLFIFLVLLNEATGQLKDTFEYHVNLAATGIINKTESSNSFVFRSGLSFDMDKDNFEVNSSASWIYGKLNRQLSNNDYSFLTNVDYIIDSTRFVVWALGNYDKSFSLRINNRTQWGTGLSYDIIRTAKNRLNISDGILYETSDLRVSDTMNNVYKTWRNSLRLKYVFNIKDLVIINGTHFLQNSLRHQSDYNVKTDLSLSLKLYKWINFTGALTYNLVNRLRRENILFTLGLSVDKYF